MSETLYDTDFYTWTQTQAALLRRAQPLGLDWENLAEELESMGRSERHSVESQMHRLVFHLLKWRYQPRRQGSSWRLSIREARRQIQKRLRGSPSLKARLDEILAEEYPAARLDASDKTGLPLATFPTACPWTVEQVLDPDFFPEPSP